jgi:hypothetical protein
MVCRTALGTCCKYETRLIWASSGSGDGRQLLLLAVFAQALVGVLGDLEEELAQRHEATDGLESLGADALADGPEE